MLRILIGLPLLIVLLAAGGIYAAYGEIDPCRALAVERSRRAETDIGLHIHKLVEPWLRMETSQMSTGQCARELFDSWRERMSSEAQGSGDSGGD